MKTYLVIVLATCSILFQSCIAPKYIYSPATANLLELDKKGEFKAAGNFSRSSSLLFGHFNQTSVGFDLQTAYAVTNRIGIRADVYHKQESNQSITDENGEPHDKINYKKKGIELSGGFFKTSKISTGSFQIFGGVGVGDFSFQEVNRISDPAKQNFHSMNYVKLFLQPSFLPVHSANYSIQIAPRVLLMNFRNVKTDYENYENDALAFIDSKPSFFVDLILRHEFGFRKLNGVRFQLQNGVTNLLSKFSSPGPNRFTDLKYEYNSSWMSVGVILDFSKLGDKNKN